MMELITVVLAFFLFFPFVLYVAGILWTFGSTFMRELSKERNRDKK